VAADELNLPVVLIEEFVEGFYRTGTPDLTHLLASITKRIWVYS